MDMKPRIYLVGGGIGSLAAAAFMIRDGGVPGENISILEAEPVMGGSLDGSGDAANGYSMCGGRFRRCTMKASPYSTRLWNSMRRIARIRWRG